MGPSSEAGKEELTVRRWPSGLVTDVTVDQRLTQGSAAAADFAALSRESLIGGPSGLLPPPKSTGAVSGAKAQAYVPVVASGDQQQRQAVIRDE